jgi:two-component sensor histidine kinase
LKTVLIIDDDLIILELMSAYLTLQGFRPVTAPDGPAGLEAFSRERPDAVLCDLTMPGLGGLGVLAEVKRRSPLTPFVVVSGTNDLSLAVEALRQGAWDYLLKPLPGLELLPPLLARMEERALFLREKELYQSRLEEQIKVRTAQLMRQLHQKDLLLAEVHHRVKNNLQVILTLLGLQHNHSTDPIVRMALEASQNRIHALAMVQEEMHDPDHATLVNALHYGTGLIHHLLLAYDLTARVDLTLEIEDLSLPPGLAFTCGLVLNELMTGLSQAGIPTVPWSLTFRWRSVGPGQVELALIDSRSVWADWVPAPDRPSLGWDLVSALVAPGGAVTWNPNEPGTIVVRLSS